MAHDTAYAHCRDFFRRYASKPGRVLDVGGDGGGYEEIVEDFGSLYFALDLSERANYDVTKDPYDWHMIKDGWFDYVICSSTMEHIPLFWLTFHEMCRVCKPGGYVYLNVPSSGPHHWDRDCWRFQKDSMAALLEWVNGSELQGMEMVETTIDTGTTWCDCVGIFRRQP